MIPVTVGIDIGTTSVKAIAADADGEVVARSRVPHLIRVPAPDRLEHDPQAAWRDGVRQALTEVSAGVEVQGVNVAAMVPSLCAVDERGEPLTPGLLYGDARGASGSSGANPADSGELLGFLRWCAAEAPGAAGYWPAQAVANHALCGVGAIDSVTAMTAVPLFDYTAWDPAVAATAGVDVSQLPLVVPGADTVGTVEMADGAPLAGGTIDAFAEQLVAGADHDGDVLVICGATLITWAVTSDWVERPGLWTIPHTAPGKVLIGGPSNAGGLFLNWAASLFGDTGGRADDDAADRALDPDRVPVWLPYVRGERTPLHDPARRAELVDLDLTHGPAGGAPGRPRSGRIRGAPPPRPGRRRRPPDRRHRRRRAGRRVGASAGRLHRPAGGRGGGARGGSARGSMAGAGGGRTGARRGGVQPLGPHRSPSRARPGVDRGRRPTVRPLP